jgi:hypothetical protein
MRSLLARRLAPLLLGVAALASGVGCAAPALDDADEQAGAIYKVPSKAAEGESMQVVLSDFPARSRDAAERTAGKKDDVIATWHVHHVVTDDGFAATMVYGADTRTMVRLALVLADDAKTMAIVEPDSEEETVAPSLAELKAAPQRAISQDELRWFADELARISEEIDATALAEKSGLGTREFQMSGKCAARLATTALTLVAGVVLSPVGGFVAGAIEAAAWGDLSGAAVIGTMGGAYAATEAAQQSQKAWLRKTGKVAGTLGKVGLGVGIVAVVLYLGPKEAASALIPPQCQSKPGG